ncbi:Integrase catalytic core [Arabidopsis suecica]|uniref:Integrase catalytic core n=1 Tax=Arabidopsis suecica TaxID=45249 RepID=A0A8T1XQ87_ARASU|nr:Integrase catalytic core [Arabidopsis suecica]
MAEDTRPGWSSMRSSRMVEDTRLCWSSMRSSMILQRMVEWPVEAEDTKCLQVTTLTESSKWHARLGHVNLETMKMMINEELVSGIPRITVEKEICASCLFGKQTRKSFPQATTYRASQPLELIHGDLCGPITPSTTAHKRYAFVIIDDYSRGGEFVSHEFQGYCDKYGIKRHLTAPYSPQQNGVVERRNRPLLEMTRSILKHMNVPNYLCGEAGRNRVLTMFECLVASDIQEQRLLGEKKLDDRSRMLVHLGTDASLKAYRLFDPTTKKIIVSRDVIFDESKNWSWNNVERMTGSEYSGTFVVELGEFGNKGIKGIEAREKTEENIHDTQDQSEDVLNEEEVEVENDGNGDDESEDDSVNGSVSPP